MGLTDIFKIKHYKNEIEKLSHENKELETLLTPELQDTATLQRYISELQQKTTSAEEALAKLQCELSDTLKEREAINLELEQKQNQLISMDDEILVQEFGLYQPQYDFTRSEEYKDRLKSIRDMQKQMIKSKTAATGNINWTVNGSASKGRKMIADMQKLLLRAFNTECDALVAKVKYNNFDASLKRMNSSVNAISKLGKSMDVTISDQYLKLKVEELELALEYQLKKEDEKEALRAAREEMRENAKLQKEIEVQRKKIQKEQNHYLKALADIIKQLEKATESERQDLMDKKLSLENELGLIETSLKDIDYREANQRAGYVYIISNIGAFGKNIYKIGMTRRLVPEERISELSSASVPFNFDIHAMIFTDDAPGLENALHRAFEDRKVNMVNHRREFFHVTLEEIKEVIKNNFDKTVEFIDVPDAEQYRITQKLKLS